MLHWVWYGDVLRFAWFLSALKGVFCMLAAAPLLC